MWPESRSTGLAVGAAVAASVGAAVVLRRWALRFGTTVDERLDTLPGDDQVPFPDLVATRAVTIAAAADRVWPWVVQIGQGRGGFYSYSSLENLVGANIHNADRIASAWQDLHVGDQVLLAQNMPLDVVHVDPGHALVLGGTDQPGSPVLFSWSFVLRGLPDGCTRLLVRERYGYVRPWARLVVEPTSLVSFLMSQRMLRGIKERAERP